MFEYPDDVSTPELNIEVPDTENAIVERVVLSLQIKGFYRQSMAFADLDSGWGLIQSSNTTPNLVHVLRQNRLILKNQVQFSMR